MRLQVKAWLQFFRIVNLPTVPGDVLVGAAAMVFGGCGTAGVRALPLGAAALASCFLYLFGLADNDIVGAKTDGPERPIPSGAISLRAARLARGLCLFAALASGAAVASGVCGAAGVRALPVVWWGAVLLLAIAIVVYNRTKWSVLMGLCRGLNVLCGGAAVWSAWGGAIDDRALPVALAALVWTLYIALVTKYSSGEELDPAKRRRVGFLVGAIVYLQLGALLCVYLLTPCLATRNLLLAGAALLILLRVMKRVFSSIRAS